MCERESALCYLGEPTMIKAFEVRSVDNINSSETFALNVDLYVRSSNMYVESASFLTSKPEKVSEFADASDVACYFWKKSPRFFEVRRLKRCRFDVDLRGSKKYLEAWLLSTRRLCLSLHISHTSNFEGR
jgi:hypothetical protein